MTRERSYLTQLLAGKSNHDEKEGEKMYPISELVTNESMAQIAKWYQEYHDARERCTRCK